MLRSLLGDEESGESPAFRTRPVPAVGRERMIKTGIC